MTFGQKEIGNHTCIIYHNRERECGYVEGGIKGIHSLRLEFNTRMNGLKPEWKYYKEEGFEKLTDKEKAELEQYIGDTIRIDYLCRVPDVKLY